MAREPEDPGPDAYEVHYLSASHTCASPPRGVWNGDELCGKIAVNMSHQQWKNWVPAALGYIAACPGLPVEPDN
jgi:hypothetical protein